MKTRGAILKIPGPIQPFNTSHLLKFTRYILMNISLLFSFILIQLIQPFKTLQAWLLQYWVGQKDFWTSWFKTTKDNSLWLGIKYLAMQAWHLQQKSNHWSHFLWQNLLVLSWFMPNTVYKYERYLNFPSNIPSHFQTNPGLVPILASIV